MATAEAPHPLDVAAVLVGGRSVLAKALGVSVAAVGNWKTRGMVPIEHCPAIEAMQKQITRRDLRPDDWQRIWPELATTAASAAGGG